LYNFIALYRLQFPSQMS